MKSLHPSVRVTALFAFLGAVLWGLVSLWRSGAPTAGALALLVGCGPNIACAWLAVFALCLLAVLLGRPLSKQGLWAVLAVVFCLGCLSECFYFLVLGHGFDWLDLSATAIALLLEAFVLKVFLPC